jgi:hypothetical protein
MSIKLAMLAIGLSSTLGCVTTKEIAGSGVEKSDTRSVGKIESVTIAGNVQVKVTNIPAGTMKVVADDNLLSNIVTKVDDENLTVDLTCEECELVPKTKISIEISSADFEKALLSDDASIEIKGFKGEELSISASDSAKISIADVSSDEIALKLSDDVEATVSGSVKSIDIETQDDAKVNAVDLAVKEAEIDASDSTDISLDVSDLLEAKMFDSAKLTLKREPTKSETKVEDSAVINRAY